MKASAVLRLRFHDDRVRSSLLAVLAPDNRELPRGLLLSARTAESAAEFSIESDSASTSLSTVIALLRDATLFQEVWLLSHRTDARVRRP